jgi:molecular chaperone GrpE
MMTDEKNLGKNEDFADENQEVKVNTEENATNEKSEIQNDKVQNDVVEEKPANESGQAGSAGNDGDNGEKMSREEELLVQKDKEINELKEYLQRLAAEFDNYKKRTRREKEKIYASSVADVVSAFLPVVDNIERALQASEGSLESIREGVVMIHRQMMDVLAKLGVKPIEAKGKKFNPDFHEAIAHIEDESYGENEIVEEFVKGYIYNDETVIRHSVVKVAN